MNPRRIAAILLRQYYLYRGSPVRVLPLFVWAAIDIVLWGFITRYLGTVGAVGTAVPTLLGAVLLWDFLQRVMHSVAMTFLEDVWSRNFLNIFATPLSVVEYITGLTLSGIIASQVGLAVMLLIAVAGFGLAIAIYGAAVFAFISILLLFGVGLGIFGAALVLRMGPSVEWLIWPIPAILSPFACVFYPVAILPGWMQAIAHVMPPMYVFEGMRGIVRDGHFSAGLLLASGGLAVLYVLVAAAFFVHVHRYAIRSGLIARYSAESVE